MTLCKSLLVDCCIDVKLRLSSFGINETRTEQGPYSKDHLPIQVPSFAYLAQLDIHFLGDHVQLHATPARSRCEEQL